MEGGEAGGAGFGGVQGKRTGVAELVADEGFGLFEGCLQFVGGFLEGLVDDFGGVGVVFPHADDVAAVDDGVAGEVGDLADGGGRAVKVDQAVDAGEQLDLGLLGALESAEGFEIVLVEEGSVVQRCEVEGGDG